MWALMWAPVGPLGIAIFLCGISVFGVGSVVGSLSGGGWMRRVEGEADEIYLFAEDEDEGLDLGLDDEEVPMVGAYLEVVHCSNMLLLSSWPNFDTSASWPEVCQPDPPYLSSSSPYFICLIILTTLTTHVTFIWGSPPRFFLLGSHRVLCCFHTKFFQTHGGYVIWVIFWYPYPCGLSDQNTLSLKFLWIQDETDPRSKNIQVSQRNQQQRPRASPHQDPSLEEKVRWTQRCLRWSLFYPKNTWSDCSSFSQLHFQVSNDVSMWKTWTPCLSLCFFGGTKWFQSKEGDSGIHYNPHLLRPSECGRSCGISGFLGHWRMLAEGTQCPNHVVTSMFFIWKKCERRGTTCETPSFKSWSRTFYSHHASSKSRKKNKSGRMMVGVKGLVDRENRGISSLFTAKQLWFWHNSLHILIQHPYNFSHKDHEFIEFDKEKEKTVGNLLSQHVLV